MNVHEGLIIGLGLESKYDSGKVDKCAMTSESNTRYTAQHNNSFRYKVSFVSHPTSSVDNKLSLFIYKGRCCAMCNRVKAVYSPFTR
jgi:hypothetical protein